MCSFKTGKIAQKGQSGKTSVGGGLVSQGLGVLGRQRAGEQGAGGHLGIRRVAGPAEQAASDTRSVLRAMGCQD